MAGDFFPQREGGAITYKPTRNKDRYKPNKNKRPEYLAARPRGGSLFGPEISARRTIVQSDPNHPDLPLRVSFLTCVPLFFSGEKNVFTRICFPFVKHVFVSGRRGSDIGAKRYKQCIQTLGMSLQSFCPTLHPLPCPSL